MNEKLQDYPLLKLQWACRRGMLELDVLLRNFLDEAYPTLNSQERLVFVALLECSDPELFAWLTGQMIPQEENLAKIVGLIRAHARSRF